MARTRKAILPLDLYKYDVLIEDQGPRSDYFKISQFDGYFYGGRNAFLIAGAAMLRPNSKILVEVINKNGTTVYSAPIRDFLEGNSRLIQVEVYGDTPIGPGKIVVLGSTDTFIDGRPIPDEWKGKYNVRWISDVIISPLIENRTPIRFTNNPKIEVTEKFYSAPSSSIFSQSIVAPVDVQLTPKYYNVYPNGYLIEILGPNNNSRFFNTYLNGTLTGSIVFQNENDYLNINLPITKIYNNKIAESEGSLLYTDKKSLVLNGFVSASGSYTSDLNPFGSTTVTSSLNVQYNELITEDVGSNISFAEIRLTDLSTISGEVYKTRVSYKTTVSPSSFTLLSDVNLDIRELLLIDTGSTVAETGKFTSILLNDYWYSATMSVARTDFNPTLPNYYFTSSIISGNSLYLNQCCTDLLDSINATPPIVGGNYKDNVSYFIGTRDTNTVRLAPRSEYTLQFQAFVSKTSGSIEWTGADPTMEVYLVNESGSTTSLISTEPRGQLIGKLIPNDKFLRQNFETVEFNFTPEILNTSEFGLRFVFYGAFWNIANVSLKPASEIFFSSDEAFLLLPNDFVYDDYLTFQIEYLDINNNSIGIETTSLPTYFQGIKKFVSRAGGDILTGDYFISGSLTVQNTTSISTILENAKIEALAAAGTINFDVLTQTILYYTTDSTNDWTINVRGDSSTTLNSVLDLGESITVVFLSTNGATPYYQTGFEIDGVPVTPKWQAGTAPTYGNVNSIDVYTFAIIKTANATFTVLASQIKFS